MRMHLWQLDTLLLSVLLLKLDIILCETTVHYGPETPLRNDAWTAVKCPCGSVGIKCECEPWPSCDGAFFHQDGKCRAYCSGRIDKVKPKVTCEREATGVTYTTVRAPATGRSKKPVAKCPEGSELVSCSIHSYWMHKYPGNIATVSDDTCTTSMDCGTDDSNGCTSRARCKTVTEEAGSCEEGTFQMVDGSPNKYLYCGENGVWHEMQCPCNEVFFPETNACGPDECRNIFDNKLEVPSVESVENPCIAVVWLDGNSGYAYDPDHTKYIECESEGVAIVRPCPPMMIWNDDMRKCTAVEIAPIGSYDAPCTKDNIEGGQVVHRFPENTSRYILCSPNGHSNTMSCPEGERWSWLTRRCRKRRFRFPSRD